MRYISIILGLFLFTTLNAQNNTLRGSITTIEGNTDNALLFIGNLGITPDQNGAFIINNLKAGEYVLTSQSDNYLPQRDTISIQENDSIVLNIILDQIAIGTSVIVGKVTSEDGPIPYAEILVNNEKKVIADENGDFSIDSLLAGEYHLTITSFGLISEERSISVTNTKDTSSFTSTLLEEVNELEEVVITGTMKAVKHSESPVAVEVYTPQFFKKNPTPSMFDALQNVNGVRPQINCSVCNTGDIHINGLEGPYTMILIDGMPIVSSLSTVYGLSGIPSTLIERVEIVKGPASSLYGSEAVAGLINVITKSATTSPKISIDAFSTSWMEHNVDIGFKNKVSSKTSFLTGINVYKYDNPIDNNDDNFTDVTLQDRISVFQKWSFQRPENRLFSIAGRYFLEDRWGGELQWTPEFRGTDSIYGESILTKRYELIGMYQLPMKEKVTAQLSLNAHNQNSVYGDTWYLAQQNIAFGQLLWDKKINKHDLLVGTGVRYTYYDDNTPATMGLDSTNNPDNVVLPGIFVQDEISFSKKHKLLTGIRYDYNSNHGNIFTPRLGYKFSINKKNIIRLNSGTGFRVVNLFTEDHAALTGSRTLIIEEDLKPEQSYNVNLSYEKKIYPSDKSYVNLDFSGWYTYFTNQIIPDYDTDPTEIRYSNLDGFAVSRGLSINADIMLNKNLKVLVGGTLMDVSFTEAGVKDRPFLTENWTGTWAVTYTLPKLNVSIDYTGNIYGSMKLPVLNDQDPRLPNSPVWSLQNIKFTWGKKGSIFKCYAGIKNLLNWTPNQGNPFLIARAHDPFDKNVSDPIDNPNNLSFDPAYVYAPNQGLRVFAGLSIEIK